ncbi:MAG: PHP domain-containing protein [Methanotrichaceae archaeon]|jgi:predicted metal-dependent phosphoesterase TrpH
MKFDLHIHSTYSDGHADVKEIIKAAKRRGLDGMALTDHDTMRGIPAARRYIKEQKLDLILIPGIEVTTSEGHLLVLGVDKAPEKKLSPEETIEIAHDLGGIADVPHPYHPFRHAIGRIPDADAVEVYNSKHLFGLANGRAKFEAKRRGMSMVAGSDSHFSDTVGLGVTEIEADNVDGVLEAIRAGRTKILGKRTPPQFFIGNTVTYIYRAIVKNARRV